MTDEQILECTKAVYDFLCDVSGKRMAICKEAFWKCACSNRIFRESFGDDPLNKKMTETLIKYGFNMVDFCQFVNDKYNFYENPLWVKTGQEFFSDGFSQPGPSRAKLMLKSIIRNYKIDDVLC
jgi:hypothetical protein